ncbi:GntR family transcriptional regulator [Paenibacillus arenilitoris]|uniref:GntR family transcriptional regulator n=1 Tax=Paenibacillus arenilitoris TaxID=2772299 RepID=A0A927H5Z4_9BACL|nr:GntR family transcriptional regulator [Paenibacillus arenilitoris]MBD2868952.1 GntR family transcriptional regulator [Paenibacillus arenilitoris]
MASESVRIAYEKILNRIMNGDYMPGDLLSENELAEWLNMSRTPVRMAVYRLESEGYVDLLKNRGIVVKELSLEEMLETVELFDALLKHAFDKVEEYRIDFDLEKIHDYLQKQIIATEEKNYYEYSLNSVAFILSIFQAFRNQVMLETIERLLKKLMITAVISYKRAPHLSHFSATPLNKKLYDYLLNKDYERIKKWAQHYVNSDSYISPKVRSIISSHSKD